MKELLLEILNNIDEINKSEEKLQTIMEQMFEDFFGIFKESTRQINFNVDLISKAFKESEEVKDWVEWFLYDRPNDARVSMDTKEWVISTNEDLVDFLLENFDVK